MVLRLQDVSCALHGRVVLDRVNLCVAAGEMALLRGGRGAGKSTLLAIAAAVVRPGAGRVLVADRDVVGLQASSLPFVRRNIGYLPPEPPLIAYDSALENVMLALAVRGQKPDEAEFAAEASLLAVGLRDPIINVPVSELSWLERRLVAVARAIVGAPALVVLDEPAAGMDGRDRNAIVKLLCDLQIAGSAILCGSSDPAMAALFSSAGATDLELQSGRLLGANRMTVLRGERVSPVPDAAVFAFKAASDDVGEFSRGANKDEDFGEELSETDIEAVADDPLVGCK